MDLTPSPPTTIASDPNGMPRPRRISTSDGSFDTGNYAYDGAGNILSIGPDYFAYDPNSRLLWANYPTGFQSYAYDTFGNLISKAGASITVDPTTNRLTAALYDARGNVTRLGNETYSYDALNRQTKHDAPGSSWTYLLDGADERIVKAIPAGGNVLRREAARIILQAMGEPPRSACAGYFSQDVPCNDPDRGWIEKFYEKGITSGCVPPPNGKYCPDSTTTRAQMAVFLASGMAGSGAAVPSSGTVPGVGPYVCTAGGTSLFGDVPAADVFCKFIHYIFATGVTGGCSTNPRLYCPNDTTSHWQMGYFVSRGWNGFQYVPPGATYTFRGSGAQVLSEFQDSKVSKDYIYLGNRLVATNESAVGAQPAGWKYHVTDHLGSVRLTTNESRQVVESRKFWPWGETVGQSGLTRMAFAGMELDVEAIRPRYYDHARNLETGYGRFLSPDKLSGHVEDPQTWNRYTYARSNPLKYVDPDGLEEVTILPPPAATIARWNAEQRAAENLKNAERASLAEAEGLIVARVQGPSTLRRNWTRDFGDVPDGQHIDHIVDRQLSGGEAATNGRPMDSSVNTSNGNRTARALRGLAPGTIIRRLNYTTLSVAPILGYLDTAIQVYGFSQHYESQNGRAPTFVEVIRYVVTGETWTSEQIAQSLHGVPSI